jgi:hypothetical protein
VIIPIAILMGIGILYTGVVEMKNDFAGFWEPQF